MHLENVWDQKVFISIICLSFFGDFLIISNVSRDFELCTVQHQLIIESSFVGLNFVGNFAK
jgi:hypothetical protein